MMLRAPLRRCLHAVASAPRAARTISLRASGLQTFAHASAARRHFSAESKDEAAPTMTPAEEAEMKRQIEEMMKTMGQPGGENADMNIQAETVDEEKIKERKLVEATEKHGEVQESQSFQAETREILDIMANSLYTDREVFIRELISNASDALEKARYLQTHDKNLIDPERDLEIHISTDVDKKTITFQDFGVGMTAAELVKNLGTIARSGSKQFVKEFKEGSGEVSKDGATGDKEVSSIIGRFGVGFYSSLMVGTRVDVYSQSCELLEDGSPAPANFWTTDGDGSYQMSEASGVVRGTKIIIHLKENAHTFSVRNTIEGIVKKYSNFVGFPIYLNGEKVNTVDAIWAMDRNSITEEMHQEFYRYIANAYDSPPFRLHFKTDAPIDINALFYIPERHLEKMGMGRLDPGVSLYSRKVLIQSKSTAILPEWARFVKGVVDSEDIPLNISRENMQDSALIARLNTVLTKRLIKFLQERGDKEPEAYNRWFVEFGQFLKEGVCTDFQHKEVLARLLRFDSSLTQTEAQDKDAPPSCSLDDYISRIPPEQQHIYYLSAPTREFALESPYYETFEKKGVEVLFLYQTIDDFVMKNLDTYQTRKLISIESTEASEHFADPETEGTKEEREAEESRSAELLDFVQEVLSSRLTSVKLSSRLTNTPAIVVDHESAAFRRMMQQVEATHGSALSKQKLEINAKHPVFLSILEVKKTNVDVASLMVEQVFDNALIAADILDNPRTMLARLNKLLANVGGPAGGVKEAEPADKA